MIDVDWVAVIVAFVVGALLGGAITAIIANSGHRETFKLGVKWGQDTCPRVHEWGENTG